MINELKSLLGAAKQGYETGDQSILIKSSTALKLIQVYEAAKKHVKYAKDKQDCGPCFDYCPNAVDGDLSCECGGSMMWCAFNVGQHTDEKI